MRKILSPPSPSSSFCKVEFTILRKLGIEMHFSLQKFAHVKNLYYLCTEIENKQV